MLRHELESRGVQTVSSHIAGPAQHAGPSQAPPALGHGPSNLFGGIMANQGGSAPGLAPPQDQQPPQHTLQQPAAAAPPGAPQPPQSSFGGYQAGAAVNGMLRLF
jgi:glucose repression regulatory protein TUP1